VPGRGGGFRRKGAAMAKEAPYLLRKLFVANDKISLNYLIPL